VKAIQRNTFFKRAAFVCTAVATCGTLAAALSSGTALAQSQQGEIVIPDDVKIFGNDNPNLRRATAVVNGSVITGTDVDQRLALILAANQGKISEDEQKRLRLQVLRNLIDETLQIQEA